MTLKNSHVSSRWSPAIALLLASLAFNTAVQAQDVSDRSTATDTSAVFTVEATPNPGFNNILGGISGDSDNDIWAVGTLANGAFALHFDGLSWTSVPMALPTRGDMRGVSVLSPTDVWSVGSRFNTPKQHFSSVIQHFDGNQWSLVAHPQFADGSQLFDVKAISANDVFAVGETGSDDGHKAAPLVLHFDGRNWNVVPVPPPANGHPLFLDSIAAISPTDIWVTGFSSGGPAVIMHFDGQQFNNVPFPMAHNASLGGLAAIATNDVWVVGSTFNGTIAVPLTAHWDGKAWTRVPSPNPPVDSALGVAAAISSSDVWAAGCTNCGSDAGGGTIVIEHWDGKQWTLNPDPPLVGRGEIASSIVAFPSGNVYVAGTSSGPQLPTQTLILHTKEGK